MGHNTDAEGLLNAVPLHESVCASVGVLAQECFGGRCTLWNWLELLLRVPEVPGVVLNAAGGTRAGLWTTLLAAEELCHTGDQQKNGQCPL